MDLKVCLELHTQLDEVFATTGDVGRLPALISQVGRRFIPCEFISMWLFEPRDRMLVNLVARFTIDGNGAADVRSGEVRLAVKRGAGEGTLENLAAELLDGVAIDDMPRHAYIINDRKSDQRVWAKGRGLDDQGLRSELYAPMQFNGFMGMLCALNHVHDAFTTDHFELLQVLANKAAVAVWSIRERQHAEASSRLALLGRAVDLVRHEMQSPLTIIKGASHMMRQILNKEARTAHDDEVLSEMVDMVAAEVERNRAVLDQIREYCQPVMSLRLERGSLNDFLEAHHGAIALSLQSARRGHADLRYDLGSNLPPVDFSPLHLLGVLRNLVRNACEVGCSVVEIRTERSGEAVCLSVEDDGGGVDDGQLASLFVPYESTNAMAGGSGLGLFLCRRVVEEGHGGQVRALNVYEDGARRGLRVELRLPPDGKVASTQASPS